ncbi:MAG: hypothetical protein H0V12_09440 [Chloroflexi bacterium]|nr:hypothetical protein [Chloroflexota bacterium]MBA3890075.1 hypothetical protein [Gemmatimonadaceae bacterium]
MRITTALKVMSAAAFAALAACSADMPSAPVAASPDVAAPSFAKGGNGNGNGSATATTIRVNTQESRFYSIGSQSWVYIPAGAICADGSGYGPEFWDAPCTLATGTIDIPVTLRADNGRPSAEFHHDVRFAPAAGNHWSQWVILGLKVQGNLNRQLGYGILYRPTGTSTWIDEAATDPSLEAFRVTGNVIARRLKHFSGYNVALGYREQADPTGGTLIGGAQ